jgi:hypothetical protein
MVEIRTLKEGEKITENGFYDIPLSQHHGQPCDGVSVTSGVLRKMELASPADVWAHHQLNPKRKAVRTTHAMHIGGAMAAYIAGGKDELQKQFYCLRKGHPKRPTDAQWVAYLEKRWSPAVIKSCEAWAKVETNDRPALTFEDRATIYEMGEVLRQDPAAMAVMHGLPEVTMAVFDEASQIWLLARPDTVSLTGFSSDYKKIATRGGYFHKGVVDKRITEGGFDMQMGLADICFTKLMGQPLQTAGIIAQWSEYPYHVIPRGFTELELEEGRALNLHHAMEFRKSLDSGYWAGPAEEIGDYQRPDYRRRQINRRLGREDNHNV